jgi:hypothetical protein
VIVDPDFLTHWRTQMVADALGDGAPGGDLMAPLYILRIWSHCQQRKATRFEKMPAAGLKALCKFGGDAQALEQALIDGAFVEREGDAIVVPGWAIHNAKLIAAWENGAKGGKPKGTHDEPNANPTRTDGEPNPNPRDTDKSREDKSREETKSPSLRSGEARPPKIARPDDVSDQIWTDWCQLRKQKKASVTATVLKLAREEAAAADLTLEQFLSVWCLRGSQGLQAAWLKPDERGRSPPPNGKHTGFETKDYHAGVNDDGSFS